jgi:hypothetical protein
MLIASISPIAALRPGLTSTDPDARIVADAADDAADIGGRT